MTSLEILSKCHLDLFPKKKTICDDVEYCVECMRIVEQFPTLHGEYIKIIGPSGKQNEDILLVTNFRIFILMHESVSFINVPIMLVESIEIKEILFLYVYLKNAKTIRVSFSTTEKASLWYQRINSMISKSIKLEELFAFTFYSWLTNEKPEESIVVDNGYPTRYLFSKNEQSDIILNEYKRMNFNKSQWRLSNVNKNFELCPTYPETVIVPACINDEQIKKIASFRSSKRFPAVVWRSKSNGAVLARSSQPNVGLLGWRLNEDELLIKAIAESSSKNHSINNCAVRKRLNETEHIGKSTSVLLIIDARFRSVALANRVKGGGYEYTEYYTNSELQFMNLENIHVIRNSFHSLRLLCQSVNDNKTFYSQLENTKWLQHLSVIIKAACTVTNSIDRNSKSVLIHCSDGWDRTPQILALAKIMLDPFYRTIDGFRTLIEQDWLLYGHKFAQRNGHADSHNDVNERCPVFLQWLDCVYQMQRQFSWAFEFNETFLLKLCHHSYSCLFGTFLCDSVVERVIDHIEERTFSLWSYLNKNNREIINYLYDDGFEDVMYPNYELNNMQLWSRLFCDSDITYLGNRQNMQGFTDSVDMLASTHTLMSDEILSGNDFRNNSSHHIDDDLDLDTNILDLKLSSIKNLDIGLKKINEVKVAGNAKAVVISGTQQIKTRSYENLSKSFRAFDSDNSYMDAQKNNMDDSSGNLNNSSITEFPIWIRSCSESNLLRDALQTITSTSPKQIYHISSSNSSFINANNNNNNNPCNPILIKTGISRVVSKKKFLDAESKEEHEHSIIDPDTSLIFDPNIKIVLKESLNDINDINLPANLNSSRDWQLKHTFLENNVCLINSTNHTRNTSAVSLSNSSSNTSLLRMQDSTDTLVNEASRDKKFVVETVQFDEETIDLSKKEFPVISEPKILDQFLNNKFTYLSNILKRNLLKNNNTDEVISIPLNSLIISTELSKMRAIENFNQPISNMNPSENAVTSSKISDLDLNLPQQSINRQLAKKEQDVGSCLSESVNSEKFCYINKKREKLENNFNENHSYGVEGESILKIFKTSKSNPKNTASDEIELNVDSNILNFTEKDGFSYESRVSKLKQNENANKRIPSKSIPIARENGDERKKKRKNIQDCIDIDGLTKIDDKSCRKFVERDIQYKKEIACLKEQVNKCKFFISNLNTNSHLWQNGSNLDNFINNDAGNKIYVEDSHCTNYSFSNESVCSSSWDEIDEADYRLAPWVPDYYVTHCQGCNNKFSYRLRKHHCRNCGQVFCYQCADQFSPLPNFNLTAPARVCYNCMMSIEEKKSIKLNIINSATSSSNIPTSYPLLSNPIKYEKQSQKKILIQNQQSLYSDANDTTSNNSKSSCNNSNFTNNNNDNKNSSNCNLNQRCNQFESSIEFKKNRNESQKVSV